MHPIGQAIETLFQRENWKITKRDDHSYTFGFRGENNRYDFFALIGERNNTLCVYSVLPMQSPENKLAEIAEFLHRANYGMIIGNFELDFRDGEIRYKVSIDFQENAVNPDDINEMIDCALAMSDRYIPGIGGVVFGGQSVKDAIEMVEGSRDQ